MFSVVTAVTVTVNASLLSAMVSDTVENSIVEVSPALIVIGVVVTRLKSSTIVAVLPDTCKPLWIRRGFHLCIRYTYFIKG